MSETIKKLPVSGRAAARMRVGHPWVFANEVTTSLKAFEAGEVVEVVAPDGKIFGTAYVNPSVLIAARLISASRERLDRSFLKSRLNDALAYREKVLTDPRFGRIVFSESDGLPGFVLDRYGDVFALQTLTMGASRVEHDFVQVIQEVTGARAIVAVNDAPIRKMEGLPLERALVAGELSEAVVIEEHGLHFEVDLIGGQKTGHFYDQRDNRRLFESVVGSGEVLDQFCYTGSWSLIAARCGATVIGRDSSKGAIRAARHNAELNGLSDRCTFERRDLFDSGEIADSELSRFEAVVLDPPPLARTKKTKASAVRAMARLVREAALRVAPGGVLVACSCSFHMSAGDLLEAVAAGAAKAKRQVRVIAKGGQTPDHPILPALPETEYLRALFLEVR